MRQLELWLVPDGIPEPVEAIASNINTVFIADPVQLAFEVEASGASICPIIVFARQVIHATVIRAPLRDIS